RQALPGHVVSVFRERKQVMGLARFETIRRPRVFTRHEQFIDALREELLTCGMTYTQVALKTGGAHSTIHNIATGRTKWPRHTTLFPLVQALGKRLAMVDGED